jgi:hypothetical protein
MVSKAADQGPRRVEGKMTKARKARSMIRTRLLIHVVAARRSGQHAVMWWLRSLMESPHLRFNNCHVPYRLRKRDRSDMRQFGDERLNALFINYEDKEPRLFTAGYDSPADIEAGRAATILILRDPFNNLASKRRANPERDRDYFRLERELWKSHAREFLGETDYLGKKILLNYNDWFRDSDSRTAVTEALETDLPASHPAAERALAKVPWNGRSQFESNRFDGRAQEMKVLERWKAMSDDPIYGDVFADEELVELSRRLFDMGEVYRRCDAGNVPRNLDCGPE